MRTITLIALSMFFLLGCGKDESRHAPRAPIVIDDLGIVVRGEARSYLQSDQEGAFLVGTVGGGHGDADRWSIGGAEVVQDFVVETPAGALSGDRLDSAWILPYETRKFYAGGTAIVVSILEHLDGVETHGLVVQVRSAPVGRITLRVTPGKHMSSVAPEAGRRAVSWKMPDGRDVVLSAGEKGIPAGYGIAVDASGSATFLVMALPHGANHQRVAPAFASIDSLRAARKVRMERLLNFSYVKTSDDTLNKALQWMKLSLDGLIIDQRDTFAVAGLPWDGSLNLRANAQSIAGLGLATGDYSRTSAIIRTLAKYQNTDPKSPTYGRFADRVAAGRTTYDGADVAPWFVRELYEHVVYSNDTALVRAMYPAVRKSLVATAAGHTDKYNFLLHGPYETWMSSVPRGNRAVEIQLLWYFQQLIGSYVATFLGDTANARMWWDSSVKTSDNFGTQFADTATNMLADFLTPKGVRDMVIRPNAIACLEMLEAESMRFGVTKATVKNLLLPYGVASSSGEPVWTWLSGPVTYALTRYDRQDLSYIVTKSMARLALTRDLVGTLPAMLTPAPSGERASLTGMAEFIRSAYQDYLGLRVDLAANTITIQPKLPDELNDVAFTVHAGTHAIRGSYVRTKEGGRVELDALDLPREMKVTFLWIMDDGDAWRGTAQLRNGVPLTLVFRQDNALLFQGDTEVEIEGSRQMKNFSQKKLAAEFFFAPH